MIKHTQGPWGIGEFKGIRNQIFDAPNPGGRVHVAEATCNGLIGKEESEANARLIASAPELLEALEAMLDVQSNRRHPLGAPDEGIAGLAAEAASKARAAIARAKGGAA